MKRRAVNGSGCEVKDIPIEQLEIDPMNIRGDVALDQEFAESIADQGVIQIPIVRPRGNKYGVVIGARRFTAAKNVGLKILRCEVRKLSDEEAMCLSATENRKRKDIPVSTWVELTTKLFNKLTGAKTARVKKIVKMVKISEASVWEYLDMAKLPSHLRIRLEEPEKRSKPKKELLERVVNSPASSEEKTPIGEKSLETSSLKKEFPIIPERVMRVLARDKDFQKWSKKEPERAHRVATEAAERGSHHVEEVLKAERRREKEKPTVRIPVTELQGPPPPLKVQLGRPIMDALEKYVKDKDIISPEIAVKIIVGDFLTREGYCGKIQTSHLKTKREVSV